LFTQPALK